MYNSLRIIIAEILNNFSRPEFFILRNEKVRHKII